MKPWTRVVLLSLALLGQPALSLVAEAGYSSGRSSVSRSSSAGRSSPSRSSGSSSSSSSRSYSSGRNSSSSGSSSHSSGSNSSSSGYSSGKGTSYSSGKGTSYSSGKQSSYASPGSGSFGAAAAAARREESQRAGSGSPAYSSSGNYIAGSSSYSSQRPGFGPSAYRGPDPRDRQIADLRARLDASSYANRHLRQQQFYGAYYSRPMVSYGYHDGYSPWFWMWLLDRHTHQQAAWVYHHRDTMDPSRYDALVKQNAELSQRVAELERQNTPRDPTYVPSELPSADLMYSDTYAAAATQPARPQAVMPQPVLPPAAARPYSPPVAWNPPPRAHSSAGGLFRGLLFVILMASGIGALVWWMGRRQSSYEDGVWPLRQGGGAAIPPRWASQSSADTATDNPLNLQIGQRFTLDLPEDSLPLDVRNLPFVVEQILHYTTQVGSGSFHYVAYWAIARPQGGERVVMQLRVERLAAGGLAILALRLQDQFAFDQGFYDIVATDGTGVFQVTDDNTGQVTAEYYRPEGVLSSYTASVLPMSDPGQAGTMRRLQYWDYSRQMDTTGGPMCEYLIVEMEDSGWFRVFAGPQVDRSSIRV